MDVKILKKNSFRIIGIERMISTKDNQHLSEIPAFWQSLNNTGALSKLMTAFDITMPDHMCRVNAAMNYKTVPLHQMPYIIGVIDFDSQIEPLDEYICIDVPALSWVVFATQKHHIDNTTEEIQKLWYWIYHEYHPEKQLQLVNGPELEIYYEYEDGSGKSEVWLPVNESKL